MVENPMVESTSQVDQSTGATDPAVHTSLGLDKCHVAAPTTEVLLSMFDLYESTTQWFFSYVNGG